MIETAEALDNLDRILKVEGLDGVYVGPSDLSNSLGCPPVLDPEEPRVVEAIEGVVRAAKAAGLRAGIHTAAPAYARRMHALGFDFVSIGSDAGLLATKSQEVLAQTRGTGPTAPAPRSY
jgi:4-hydroxy-2-oxoheptanedioate aldolase